MAGGYISQQPQQIDLLETLKLHGRRVLHYGKY